MRRPVRLAAALALFAAAGASAAPSERQKLFSDANSYYEQSRYDDAIAGYRNLLALAPDSAALHYNLGNAYFRFAQPGSLGLAIACYERAFTLRPRDSDIRQNLDFALRRAGDSLVPPGVPWAFFILYHFLSLNELACLQWLGFWAMLLAASAFLLRREWRPALGPWLAGAAAAWALTASWWGIRQATAVSSPGVILHSMAEVRSGPGDNFPVGFKAPEGRLVTILDARGNWLEIGVLKEGLKGWLPADAVEKI